LFSGGVDSAVVAAGLKQLGKDFTCYVCGTSPGNTSRPRDVEKARETAEAMDLDLEVVEPSLGEIQSRLPELADAVSSTSPVKLPVALTLDFALDGEEKCVFSGLGSEQLYAGYARQQGYLNRECLSDLRGMFHRDLYRDNVVAFRNGKELRLPFLDHDLVEHALGISPELKRSDGTGKYVLRQVAESLGVPEEIAWRDKLAAQYGSNMTKAVRKLAGDRTMEDFTHGLRDRPNHRLAALTSGGKDSCAALYRASKRNNEISCLVTLESSNPDSYMFDTETSAVQGHAERLEVPLVVQGTKGEKESELEDLSTAMYRARQEYGVDGIVCGAIRSTYQRDRVEKVAERHGLKVFAPLWAWDEEDYMRWLVRKGFDIRIVDTAARGLDEAWEGEILDEQLTENLLDSADKYGFNPAGEGGEYETELVSFPSDWSLQSQSHNESQ
jgi:Predicted ATPases of PP-loop superfamily